MIRLWGRIDPGSGSGPFTGHIALTAESRRADAMLSAFTRGAAGRALSVRLFELGGVDVEPAATCLVGSCESALFTAADAEGLVCDFNESVVGMAAVAARDFWPVCATASGEATAGSSSASAAAPQPQVVRVAAMKPIAGIRRRACTKRDEGNSCTMVDKLNMSAWLIEANRSQTRPVRTLRPARDRRFRYGVRH